MMARPRFGLAALGLVFLAAPVGAKVVAPPPPSLRALEASTVIVGKVLEIEAEPLLVKDSPTGDKSTEFRIARVKIEEGLIGAEGLTHLKVAYPVKGFYAWRPDLFKNLTEGQQVILFLHKHPVGGFYTFDYRSQPVVLGSAESKDQLARVKRVAFATTHAKDALAARQAAERTFAAAVIVMKSRTPPGSAGSKEVKLSREESQTLLNALAETTWTSMGEDVDAVWQAFSRLDLQSLEGWPAVKVQLGERHLDVVQTAFREWLKGPGKNHVISKFVPKE